MSRQLFCPFLESGLQWILPIKNPSRAISFRGLLPATGSNIIAEAMYQEYTMHESKNPSGKGLGGAGRAICENFNAIVVDMTEKSQWKMLRIRCKQWSCASCAEINKRRWRAHIIDKINVIGTFEKWWFVTVTAHRRAHKAIAKHATLNNMQRGLKILYDRLRRLVVKGSEKLEYVRVYEPHKTKKIHAHLIIRATFSQASGELDKKGNDRGMTRWLKDNCAAVGLGYQASAKPITSSIGVHAGYLAAYVTKYMTKDLQGGDYFPKNLHRVRCSSGFGAMDEKQSQFSWTMKSGIYEYDVLEHRVIDLNTGQVITTDDFENHYVYPHELEGKD